MLNFAPQHLALPPSKIQLKIGMLLYGAIGLPQEQCDPGFTTDLFAGIR